METTLEQIIEASVAAKIGTKVIEYISHIPIDNGNLNVEYLNRRNSTKCDIVITPFDMYNGMVEVINSNTKKLQKELSDISSNNSYYNPRLADLYK